MAQVIHAFQAKTLELIDGKYISPHKAFRGSFIPDWLFVVPESKISVGAKACYARLCRYAGKSHECYPSQKDLAQNMGCSIETVKRRVKELGKHGLIEPYKTGTGNRSGYRFLVHEWMKVESFSEDENNQDDTDNDNSSKGSGSNFQSVKIALLKVSDSHLESVKIAPSKCQDRTFKVSDSHFLYNDEESQLRESIKRVN